MSVMRIIEAFLEFGDDQNNYLFKYCLAIFMLHNTIKSRHILAIDSPGHNQVIALKEDFYSIGRHSHNTIVIDSQEISRKHAIIIKEIDQINNESYFTLKDGDEKGNLSTNGILVNGSKCLEKILNHGDIIFFSNNIKATYYIINSNMMPPSDNNCLHSLSEHRHTLIDYRQTQSIDLPQPAISSLQDEKLASLVELSPNPILELDWQGNITYQNTAARLQFPDLTISGQQHPLLLQLLPHTQQPKGNLLIREFQTNQTIFEQHIHYLPEYESIRIYLFDITQRKQAEEILHYQAFHDQLTGLCNRTLFHEHLSIALANARRDQYSIAVLFLDLDGFKMINDVLGHSVGDQSLQYFAQRLRAQLRMGDVLSRWGGDEFTILLPRLKQADEPATIAQRILDSLTQPFYLNQQELYIKSSIGIAVYPQDGEDAETLIKNADSALYRTKEQGRNHYQFYNVNMTSQSAERFQLETLLHQAIEREELHLYYQPQVNIKTGEIQGMEALIRWQHPQQGLISPTKFIPIAEETGLILAIDEWVLKTACQQNKLWQKSGLPPVKVAVNLSARQFQNPYLATLIEQVLNDTQLDPCFLEVEVTETALIKNLDLTRRNLERLRQLGVQVAMDDFGTGYSSLSYLKELLFHTLKIDSAFVKDITKLSKETTIISAIMTLSEGFDLRVVVEGVETTHQRQILENLKCEEMQGYLFSPPLTVQESTQFLAQSNCSLWLSRTSSDQLDLLKKAS